MKASRITAWALAAGLAVSFGSATAADLPKKGAFTAKFGWNSTGKTFEMDKGRLYWVGEFTGTLFNDKAGGIMDHAAVACPGTNDVRLDGQISSAQGNCIVTDAQGDKAFASWWSKGPFPGPFSGEFTWTGGTGKYAGIKGTSKFSAMITAPTTSGYCLWDATWELP